MHRSSTVWSMTAVTRVQTVTAFRLEDADEDVPLAEDHRLRPRELHAQAAADVLAQLAAGAAREDLQLPVRVGLL